MEKRWNMFGFSGLIPYYSKEIADKVLDDFVSVCEKAGITYILIYGTCLGFVRDGGYIKWDNDIDVLVRGNYEKLREELRKSGFKEGAKFIGYQHWWKNEILVDVHWEQPYRIKGVDKIKYNGKFYNIPSSVERYLEIRYGKNWRIPSRRTVLGGQKINV